MPGTPSSSAESGDTSSVVYSGATSPPEFTKAASRVSPSSNRLRHSATSPRSRSRRPGGIHRKPLLFRHGTTELNSVMGRNVLEGLAATKAEHKLQFVAQTLCARSIGLVHHKDVGDFH